jgi:hypothetical protein
MDRCGLQYLISQGFVDVDTIAHLYSLRLRFQKQVGNLNLRRVVEWESGQWKWQRGWAVTKKLAVALVISIALLVSYLLCQGPQYP